MKALVVDDDADAAQALSRALTAMGWECESLTQPELALSAVARFRPQVVFLDIGMPSPNGYTVARLIRSNFGDEVLLVAVLAYGVDDHRPPERTAGFDAHLIKPAGPAALDALITRLLPQLRSN